MARFTPAECRRIREQAGVSLKALAGRLHRDPSSLSRFERGQQLPRDVETVLAAYAALEPLAIARAAESQTIRKLMYRLDHRILVLLLSRWVGLALAVPFGIALGAPSTWPADCVAAFVVGSAAAALGLMAMRFRRLQRIRTTSTGGQLIIASWALGVLFCAQACIRRLGDPQFHITMLAWGLLVVEVGIIGLAWSVEEALPPTPGKRT